MFYTSLQLHHFKSLHFQPINPPIIVIAPPRRAWHDCNLKFSECYLLCPTETEISPRLKTKVNINPFSFLLSSSLFYFSLHFLTVHTYGYMHCCFYTVIVLCLSSGSFLIFKGVHPHLLFVTTFVFLPFFIPCHLSLFSFFGLHDFHIICLFRLMHSHANTCISSFAFAVLNTAHQHTKF